MVSPRPKNVIKCSNTTPGQKFPAVGLGTWQGRFGTSDPLTLEASIIHALHHGYRLIDTANFYGVESVVGSAILKSGVPRSSITLITKFWGHMHHDPAAALQQSLDSLGEKYVDVFLMHWPWATTPEGATLGVDESPTYMETWRAMESLVGEKCRSIGVSNFTQKTLEKLLENCSVVPVVNQVELHVLNPCFKLVDYCQRMGIHVMSWR
jgi:glycerol 2-dehydrogenase (NADP+)